MANITFEDYLAYAKEVDIAEEEILTQDEFDSLEEEDLEALSNTVLENNESPVTKGKVVCAKSMKLDPGVKKTAKKVKEEVEEIEEDSTAMDTLKPNSRPSSAPNDLDGSKVSMMKNVVHLMGDMDKTSMLDFFGKVMDQYGAGKDHGVSDNSGKNSASIDTTLGKGPKTKDAMPHLDDKGNALANVKKAYKEDIEVAFTGDDLSEETKEKVSTIFEAAIATRLAIETARLEEEFDARLEKELETVTEAVSEKLDAYLDYVVENWMKENEVAIESALRNEIMEEFIEGLKNLFVEHYIEIPAEKVDVVEALQAKVEELEARLDEEITTKASLEEEALLDQAGDIFEDLAKDLALTQREKFASLAEGIEFNGDLEVFEKKLKIIKESFFMTEAAAPKESNILEESFEGEETSGKVVSIDPSVNRYVQALQRTVKN